MIIKILKIKKKKREKKGKERKNTNIFSWHNKKNFMEAIEVRATSSRQRAVYRIMISQFQYLFCARNASAVIRPASLNFYYQAGCCLESGTCMTMLQIGPPVCQGEHTGSAIGYTRSHRQLYIIFTRSIKSIDQ